MKSILPVGSSLERLLSHTKPDGDCLIWQLGKTPNGYAKVRYEGRSIGGHRLALFYTTSYWGKTAQHLCDVKSCINPKHLFWGTPASNSADMVAKNRQVKGSFVKQSKLTESQVMNIKILYSVGDTSTRKLAAQFGVSKTAISYIVKNKLWKSVQK